ncbi:unnamed protein product [Bursaphelenchus xylophilus]|uniref:(pine wood nematode) hypothetical protein n=1 Tax=Bursaphelenchus xylophilus TaxID=6326 RepID=A0A1I7SF43_BURXY|nr:unnamed protein product [Bursaphelenchus xylophilus]CAG9078848.1 unnamed protein product [Bursaphelenchus xylophilus]
MNACFLIFTTFLAIALSAPNWPYSELQRRLNEEQSQEFRRIFRDGLDSPRTELNANLRTYIATLPQELQDVAAEERQRLDDSIQAARQRVQALSANAQSLYRQYAEIYNDEGISLREATSRINDLCRTADRTTLRELINADVFNARNA